MNIRGFLPLILVSLEAIGIPTCVSQNEYQTCRQLFECGSLSNLSYPFYGGNRPPSCGYPGFQLVCEGEGAPLLNISSIIYRVLAFDNQTQTIRVARNDLWSTPCTQLLVNISLNASPFDLYTAANDQEITLIYGCTAQISPIPLVLPNQFDCTGDNGISGFAFYLTREVNAIATGFTCSSAAMTVRISQTAAAALGTNPLSLQASLQSGFSIQWSCGFDQTSAALSCYCADRTSNSNCIYTTGQSGGIPRKYARIGVCIVVGAGILFIICYFTRRHILAKRSNPDVEQFLVNHGSLALKRYSYKEIKKMTKSFKDKLGQGGFGIVYKGELPDGQPVAVKVLTQTHDDDAQEFINEVASISRTSHVNIVNLLGFCYGRNKRALVYEFMPNKSLDKFIYTPGSIDPECKLGLDKLYEIAVGVARGLDYLHRGCNTRIVHFDIKPQNILLDEDFSPKISDFGLAKLFKKKQSIISMLGMRGTIGYIAPEVFSRNFGVVSHKSDVYSYGMMLLEMAEAREMAEIEPTQSSENYFPDNIYEHVLLKIKKLDDDQLVRDEKEESKIKMLMVGLWCIQTAPSDRPSMSKVVEMLEGNVQFIQIPPKPIFPSISGSTRFSSSVNVDTENST